MNAHNHFLLDSYHHLATVLCSLLCTMHDLVLTPYNKFPFGTVCWCFSLLSSSVQLFHLFLVTPGRFCLYNLWALARWLWADINFIFLPSEQTRTKHSFKSPHQTSYEVSFSRGIWFSAPHGGSTPNHSMESSRAKSGSSWEEPGMNWAWWARTDCWALESLPTVCKL